jgi:radical SAM superfamily enzyme YgiQ (UPF0313 family)
MKILLIEPPPANKFGNLRTLGSIGSLKADMAWPPLDLMIIAGLLRRHGIPSAIYDANSLRASFEDVRRLIEAEKPELVLFTTSTTTINHDLATAKLAKEVSKSILTAVTSTHISALPEETLASCEQLDFCVPSGEEFAILELIKSGYKPDGVPGITYRKSGAIVRNAPRAESFPLDELGIPAHDLVDMSLYRDPFARTRPVTVTYTSRGCVNYPPCVMCSACFYERVRYRSTASVMEELRLLKRLGVRELRFPFEGGFNDLRRANELFDAMIAEDLGITFTCNARADCLPPELALKMKTAGCTAVSIGCESVNPKTMAFIDKKVTPEQVRAAVAGAKLAGLETLVYFIFGLPYETRDSMRRTLAFAKSLDADLATFGVAIPHPGTAFHSFLKENGYLHSENWDQYDPMFPPPYSYPELSSREIFDFARHAYRSYYLRPGVILKRLRRFNLAGEWKNFTGFINRYVLKS